MKIDDFFLPMQQGWDPVLNWKLIESLPEYMKLCGCKQHEYWHREGDVKTHTENAMKALYDFFHRHPYLILSKELILATVFHDIGKPDTTKKNSEGEYTAKNHGPVGARIVREILKDEPDIRRREHVCALVREHMVLHHIFDDDKKVRQNLIKLNHTYAPSKDFLYLNYADDFGSDNEQTRQYRLSRLARIDKLFDKNLMCRPLKYRSSVEKLTDSYNVETPIISKDIFGVVIMVGFPGAGKDYFINKYLKDIPVVSRDNTRIELGLMTADKKGMGNKEEEEIVTEICNKQMMEYCENRQSFAISNTSLPMYRRRELIEKLLPYGPYITIVFVDTPLEICKERRKGEIPDHVYDRMKSTFDFPMPYEANRIIRVKPDGKPEILWDDSDMNGRIENCDWVGPFQKWNLKNWIKKKFLEMFKKS